MRDQQVEAATPADQERIRSALARARQIVADIAQAELDGSRADLERLQRTLDAGVIDPTAEDVLQALGLAFGQVFVGNEPDYAWWMIHDDYGRDPAVRYRTSSLTFHPQDMLLSRVERGERVDVAALYEDLRGQLQEIIRGGVQGA